MSLSQARTVAMQLPGLDLKAWAWISWNGSVLTTIKSYGLSGVSRSSQGIYVLTYSSAQSANAMLDYVVQNTSFVGMSARPTTQVTGSMTLTVVDSGNSVADPQSAYFAVYG